jgi:phosphoglycerate dehydrogenase-like enzyme
MKIFKFTNTIDKHLDNTKYNFTIDKSNAEIILVGGQKFSLSDFPKLKGIFKTGVGTDNLPFDEAFLKNIEIRLPSDKTKDVIYEETASYTCFLILKGKYSSVSEFDTWQKYNRNSLSRTNLLVMGVGNIGKRVASKMSSFMNVMTYDPLKNSENELLEFLNTADCVTLHMPLNPLTKSFFNKEKLSLLKNDCLLVNTSRGPLVDEDALYDELYSKRIKAAFDVFWNEPYSGRLINISEKYFIRSPHIASTCDEFLKGLAFDFEQFLIKFQD